MTTTAASPAPTFPSTRSAPAPSDGSVRRTARTTGVLYLNLGITGMLGFLLVRPALVVPDDPAGTMANLLDRELLARTGIVLELGIVVSQTLVALWFHRLFRTVDALAATSITVFGLINAVTILGSAAFLATAVEIAGAPLTGSAGAAAGQVQLMYVISENLWAVGAIFFGLWLIPMGRCVLRSGWMPRALGWLLIAGGAGYVLSAVIGFMAPTLEGLVAALTIPATIGEFWILGYLIVRGVRDTDGRLTRLEG